MTKEGLVTQTRVIALGQPEYPPLLAKIHDPPAQLYINGNLECTRPMLAVVGSRHNTVAGAHAITHIVLPVADTIGIVSGLANGIDSLAHQAALTAGGYTIAVLGSGIAASGMGPERRRIQQEILSSGGCIISEYPPNAPAMPYNFAKRNRIISGLAKATLVVEAGEKSGALITADSALQQGRDLMVIPQSIISPVGAGANKLIKDGATVVTHADDLRFYFNIKEKQAKPKQLAFNLSAAENAIVELLCQGPVTSDALGRALKLPAHQMAVHLTEMEIKGIIKSIPGNHYQLV